MSRMPSSNRLSPDVLSSDMPSMHVVPWPEAFARRYREHGHWLGIALYTALADAARVHATRTAIVCRERRWTYAEFDLRVRRFAAGLQRIGIGAGDRVLLQLPNVAEFHVASFALFRIGAIPVYAQCAHRRSEIAQFVAQSGARACIVIDREAGFDHRALMRDIRESHAASEPAVLEPAALEHVVVVGDAAEFIAFDSLYDAPHGTPGADAASVALLQLSGGSTGVPKLIPRTHDDYLYSICASVEICGVSENTVFLCVLPAAHNFPMSSPGAFGVLLAGGCVVLARSGDPATAFALIERECVTLVALVPALARVWLESSLRVRHDLGSLEVVQIGGACLAESIAARIAPAFGCTLQQVFGMAEGLVNYTRLDDPPARVAVCQGRPISDDDEIRIVDDDDQDVAPGEVGHLLTRGPYTIRGYWASPEHNAVAFTADGFYRTGDRVRRLPGGDLVVVGRAKDQINRGGEKIAAEEVEAHLLAHPAVADAALIAIDDRMLGEKACACIVARPDTMPQSRELQAFLRERGIAAYKIPDRFEFIARMPRTPIGKIDKPALRHGIATGAPLPATPLPQPEFAP